MKLRCNKVFSRKASLPLACSLLMAVLSSCGNEELTPIDTPENNTAITDTQVSEEPAPVQPEATEQEQVEEEQVDTRDLIYDIMVYQVAPALATPNSPVSSQIREVLRLLNEQYEQDKEELAGSPELTRSAILIANMRCSFGAWDAAIADYDRALSDFRAMPQETQESAQYSGWLSIIYKGKAVCYLSKNDREKAMEQLQLRLENDEKRAATIPELKPGDTISTEFIPIARDLMASMQDKAAYVAEANREEAKGLYQQYIARAQNLILLPDFTLHIQYIQLLAAAADNEVKGNNPEKAKEYYIALMEHCVKIHNGSRDANVKKVMLAYAQAAEQAYKQLEGGQQPHEITTEPINPDLPPLQPDATTPAPVTEPAAEAETTTVSATPEVKAEPEPKKETPKKSKRNRRKR